MKNLLFFKIVTNRYLKMYSLLIIIGWAYARNYSAVVRMV